MERFDYLEFACASREPLLRSRRTDGALYTPEPIIFRWRATSLRNRTNFGEPISRTIDESLIAPNALVLRARPPIRYVQTICVG